MNQAPDHRRLFDDALADDAPADFREALLQQTLRGARRRRHWRQTRHGLAIGSVAGLLTVLCWHFVPHSAPISPSISACETVRTRPLPAISLVTTQPLSADQLIESTAAPESKYREVSDDELLALAGPRSAVLLHWGDHQARLIFTDSGNQNRSPAN